METVAETYRRLAYVYRKDAVVEREPGFKEALLSLASSFDHLAEGIERPNGHKP
jgi:hypothetical protein